MREALNSFHIYARRLMTPLAPQELKSNEWTLDDPRVLRLMDKLRKAGKPLGEVVEGKFYYGIKTGFNEAFVIDEAKRAELIAADPKSAEVIKPFVRGRDVKRWTAEWAGKYLIFTRRGIDIEKYPAIKKHLEQWRDKLEPGKTGGRKAGSYKWFEIQDNIAYFEEFERPKIIWQEIAMSIGFGLAAEGVYMNNKCFFLPLPESRLRHLLPLLNSDTVKFFLGNFVSKLNGGAYALQSIYLEQLPIPSPTPTQIQALEAFTDDSRLSELNALVYDLYGLTLTERALVEELTAGAYGAAGEVELPEDEEGVEA